MIFQRPFISIVILFLSVDYSYANTQPNLLMLSICSTKHKKIDASNINAGRIYLSIMTHQYAKDFPFGQAYIQVNYAHDCTEKIYALPMGTYAVAAFLDLNDNGKLDRGLWGIPSEPYGFSNNVRGNFGPAKFSRASFTMQEQQELPLHIKLKKDLKYYFLTLTFFLF